MYFYESIRREVMKRFAIVFIAVLAAIIFTSCPGAGLDPTEIEENTPAATGVCQDSCRFF